MMTELFDQRLAGQVALVTGAAGGLGRTLSHRLAREGARVVITDLSGGRARELAESFPEKGRVLAVTLDVRRPESIDAAVSAAEERFGAVSILVNNAIVANPVARSFLETPLDVWNDNVDVILNGAVRCCQRVLPSMVQAAAGSIINVLTVNASAYYGHPPYSAAKAGLLSLTRSLAVEYAAHGVTVNAVSPGTLRTQAWQAQEEQDAETLTRLAQYYPSGRIGEPKDVAGAITYLASADARWTTGTVITVDGGLSAGNAAMAKVVEGS